MLQLLQSFTLSGINHQQLLQMDYFKTFLAGSANKQQKSKQKTEKQYQLSGEFQIIQPDDEGTEYQHQKQLNLQDIEKQYISKKCCQGASQPKIGNKLEEDQLQIVISQSHQQSDPATKQKKCQDLVKKYNVIESLDSQQIQVHASTIKIDDYFMLVDNKDLNNQFKSEQQWHKFYYKIKIHGEKQNKKSLSITFQELNSILSIKIHNYHKRTQYWDEIAKCDVGLKCTRILTNCKDLKKLQANLFKILPAIQKILQNKWHIQNNIEASLSEQNFQQIKQYIKGEVQSVKSMILQVIILYGGNDPQIGYSKGLQYVALGIILSRPKCTLAQLKSDFKYLMFKQQLRNMFFPGTPKLYQEISALEECMQSEVPRIRQRLQQINGDLMKVFIGYYKTFLIYKLTNPQVISKLFQLLLIYGIDLVRIILMRIMCKKQEFILKIDNQGKFMQYLAQNLVSDYFKDGQQLLPKKEKNNCKQTQTQQFKSEQIKNEKIQSEQVKIYKQESKIIQKFKCLFVTKDIS